ncbi:MAG: hypothetical protein OXP12_01460 [Thaumarchaeota archaeon]|nr:hypothetical protein [Nitrososphaerota archaeon]
MDMMPSGGGGADSRSYDGFQKSQLPSEMRPAFGALRQFCMSLGGNVIEDVRPHRVVFCKSMNTRWFADAKPSDDDPGTIIIKIRTGWRDPIRTVRMDRDGPAQEIMDAIAAAYGLVR